MQGKSQQNPAVPSVWGLWKPYNVLKVESVLEHTGQGLMLLKMPSPTAPPWVSFTPSWKRLMDFLARGP